jgi:hypothetical protein
MKKAPLFYVLLAVITLILNSDKSLALNDAGYTGYPLYKGNSWSYQGLVKWTSESGAIHEDKVAGTMKVLDTVKIGSTEIIKVKGSPNNFKLRDTGGAIEDKYKEYEYTATAPAYGENHIIIRTANESYYDIDGETGEELINDPEQSLQELLNENASQFLDLPLNIRKSFGSTSAVKRDDGMYCWVVKKEKDFDLTSIKGLEDFGVRKQYTLGFSTLADETEVDFVPGIGITGYRYKHNGSIEQYDIKLTGAEI